MNPWEKISQDVYEKHMSLSQVAQLQALNQIMRSQWSARPDGTSAAVLGVAGGNGLERDNFQTVYGIDVNEDYLQSCGQRFNPIMGDRLKLLQLDLTLPEAKIPPVDLMIADLLIEYVGIDNFCAKAAQAKPRTVSCVIQGSDGPQDFVSESPYQAQFQEIAKLHLDITEPALTASFGRCGYTQCFKEIIPLPNGKQLIRLDYEAQSIGA